MSFANTIKWYKLEYVEMLLWLWAVFAMNGFGFDVRLPKPTPAPPLQPTALQFRRVSHRARAHITISMISCDCRSGEDPMARKSAKQIGIKDKYLPVD